MKKFALGVLLVATVAGLAWFIWHLSQPVREVTWVRVHATVDPALPNGQVWLGDRELGPAVWIELSGRARRPFELTGVEDPWLQPPQQLVKLIDPRGELLGRDSSAGSIEAGSLETGQLETDPLDALLVAYGDYPVRGYSGRADRDGERHRWLWLIASEPGELHPCGLALRGASGERALVARDVLLPVMKTREDSYFEQVLLRRRVTERVIIVEFGLPQ